MAQTQEAQQQSGSAPASPTTGELPADFDTPGAVQPAPADAPFFRLPIVIPVVVFVAIIMLIAVFGPIAFSSNSGADVYALFALVPAVGFGVFAGVCRRGDVHFRQLFIRFAAGWLLLTPASWFAALIIIIMGIFFVSILAAFLPLPGIVWLMFFLIWTFGAITSTETFMLWLVLTGHDSVKELAGSPRQYPFFSGSIAIGMSSASSYYLILFLRSIIDGINDSVCVKWQENPVHRGHNGTSTTTVMTTPAPAHHQSHRREEEEKCHDHMSGGDMVIIIVAAVLMLQPMMALASYHVGLVAARMQLLNVDLTAQKELIAPIVFRTIFFFLFFFGPRIIGPIALIGMLIVMLLFYAFVKRYERNMPRAYLNRVGYLNLFGYGALPQDDDEDDAAGIPAPAAARAVEMESPSTGAGAAAGGTASPSSPVPAAPVSEDAPAAQRQQESVDHEV